MNSLKILIAEDDFANTFLLTEFLRQKGMETEFVTNGKDAVDYLSANPDTDLVFMDLRMPFLNGIEATRKIRIDNKKCVIIAQTAFTNYETKNLVFDAGADAFFSKPLDLESVWEFICQKFQ